MPGGSQTAQAAVAFRIAIAQLERVSARIPEALVNIGIAYEHGAIRFDYVEKPTWTFDNFKTDETPLLEQFHPADAARFVGAVRARLKQS